MASAFRRRYQGGCGTGLSGWRLVPFAVWFVAGGGALGAQASNGSSGSTRSVHPADSAALNRRAVGAVSAYEQLAYHYISPTHLSFDCKGIVGPTMARLFPGQRPCIAEMCVPQVGRAPCLLGREAPCHGTGSKPPEHPAPVDYAAVSCTSAHSGNQRPDRVEDSSDVVRGRVELFAALDSVAARIPGDRWVAGQLVWYRTFSTEFEDAMAAARSCAAEAAWCLKLRGYVLVRSGHAAEGLAAFDSARTMLSEAARCRLDDVSLLIDNDSVRSRYAALPCGSVERGAFEDRFWWLSAPSWLTPVNDRRAEHYARIVDREVTLDWGGTICADCPAGPLADAVTTPDESVRTGPNTAWVAWRHVYDMQTVKYVDRYGNVAGRGIGYTGCSAMIPLSEARYHFVPDQRIIAAPLQAPADGWDLTAGPAVEPGVLAPWNIPLAPGADVLSETPAPTGTFAEPDGADPDRPGPANPMKGHTGNTPGKCNPLSEPPERYTPAFAEAVYQLREAQWAYFRRGQRAVFMMAVDATSDTIVDRLMHTVDWARPAGARTQLVTFWNLPVSGLPRDSARAAATARGTTASWTAMTPAPWAPMVVGFESQLPPRREAPAVTRPATALLRTRFGVAPPPEPQQRVTLSDIAFYDGALGLPINADAMLPGMLGTTALDSAAARRPLGMYWEVYGIRPGEAASVSVVVTGGPKPGALSRIMHLFGGSGSPSVSASWQDHAPAGGNADSLAGGWPRALVLRLATLPAGRYTATVRVTVPTQQPVSVSRAFSISVSGAEH